MRLLPIALAEANDAITRWHRHHKRILRAWFQVSAWDGDELVGVAVVENPRAPALMNGACWEITRMATPGGRRHGSHADGAASMLARACWEASRALGVRRLVSYTRIDEPGTCYRAAGFVAVAHVEGREWAGINKVRWLPGLYQASTEIVDRVRWEIGPDAATTRVAGRRAA